MRFRFLQAVPFLLSMALAPAGVAAPEPMKCDAQEVEYGVSGRLHVSDTPMGAGDGTYDVGPGHIVLRLEGRDGRSARASLQSYEMREHFSVTARAAFWKTTVTTDAVARAPGQARLPAAEGTLNGNTLTWTSQVRGYRTDGTLSCNGDMCGNFGAPPKGQSPIVPPENAVKLTPFRFSADETTFTMDYTLLSTSSSPKQRTQLALSGRELSRKCMQAAQ
jgi:hypothetical protein